MRKSIVAIVATEEDLLDNRRTPSAGTSHGIHMRKSVVAYPMYRQLIFSCVFYAGCLQKGFFYCIERLLLLLHILCIDNRFSHVCSMRGACRRASSVV